jgi:hypothetical protein
MNLTSPRPETGCLAEVYLSFVLPLPVNVEVGNYGLILPIPGGLMSCDVV